MMWETHFQDMWADPMENDLFRSGIPPTRKPTTILQTGGLSKWVTCSIDFPYFPHLFTAKKKICSLEGDPYPCHPLLAHEFPRSDAWLRFGTEGLEWGGEVGEVGEFVWFSFAWFGWFG